MRRYLLTEVIDFAGHLTEKYGYSKEVPLTLSKATHLFPDKEARFLQEVVQLVNSTSSDPFGAIA